MEWHKAKLIDVAAKKRWALNGGPFGSKLSTKHYTNSGVPVIRGTNLSGQSKFSFDNFVYVSEEKADELRPNNAHPGDLVFTQRGTIGQVGLIPVDSLIPRFVISQSQMKLTPDPEQAEPLFLYYYFSALDTVQKIQNLAFAAGVPHINLEILRNFEVPLPPLQVQRRIAGILSAYDDLIENNQRRIKILEEMARSLYREWFVHFRFPGHDKVKMVSSPLGLIPYGWEACSIDDICELVTDGSHSSPKSVEEGLPMASSKDMHEWGLNLDTCRHISRQDFDQLVRNGCKPKKNDVLITKDGANYLKHIFVVREELELVLLSSIAILRPNKRINPHLLTAILGNPKNKDRLKSYVTGAAIPRIILSDFKQFNIVLPSQELQGAWAKIAEPISQLCWTLIDQIANLRHTRDLLLPRLLSGQIELNSMDAIS